MKAFLLALERVGSVSEGCKTARISSSTAYNRRRTDAVFREQWDAALDRAADTLEDEARRRAFAGSDNLLMFLLKGARPERFRESRASIAPAELNKLIECELERISKSKKKTEDEETAEELVN
jgi:hypothetical protein